MWPKTGKTPLSPVYTSKPGRRKKNRRLGQDEKKKGKVASHKLEKMQ